MVSSGMVESGIGAREAQAGPTIRRLGLDGLLVSFAKEMSEPANRAALAFRAALREKAWQGVQEVSSSLVSTFLRFDPLEVGHAALRDRVGDLLESRDWLAAPLPEGRRMWRVPTVFGGDLAPQLSQAADAAGLSVPDAVTDLSATPVRVLAVGFAPGQPYLGMLNVQWNIPRRSELNPNVPPGALAVAVRQLVLFGNASPTGWWHIGQTRFRPFDILSTEPFLLSPGDEMRFDPCDPSALERLQPVSEMLT